MDPLATSELIVGTYRRYLRSLLPVRDPTLAEALAAEIDASPVLTKGPLLESTPAYRPGATLGALIAEGVLDPGFARFGSAALPLDRPLYAHQEQALRKARAGRNLVVATGTGSGKTEAFLLPVLSALSAEHAAGTLGPGVRALFLYPMNALANDQLRRLRRLLAATPEITFGRYTGETPEEARAGAAVFEELNPGEPRLPNELLSREEMRQSPPHLLLTNYAMLEYLLLRPADLELFEGAHGGSWRFVVLDEAHVYDGAKAEEVGMLLRRLRHRVAAGRRLQAIATSATVGDRPRAVVEFAEALFDLPFEWVPGDPSRQDLVTAERMPTPEGSFWGPLTAGGYSALRETADSSDLDAEVLRLASGDGGSAELTTGSATDPTTGTATDLATETDPATATATAAFHALSRERAMVTLRTTLAAGPRPFAELAEITGLGADGLAALVAVGGRVRDGSGTPVLSARYHLFARATEGAFTCLTPEGPHVCLGRRESCVQCAGTVFEFGSCRRCGAVHLIGAVQDADGGEVFSPRVTGAERRTWLLLEDDAPDGGGAAVGADTADAADATLDRADEDDETLDDGARTQDGAKSALLCSRCGRLAPSAPLPCTCADPAPRRVRRLATTAGSPTGCLSCGARGSGVIRQFESGNEAAAAVLTTAFYQALPVDPAKADRPGGGRKLLTFSDSRQAAAYFAPYLESSHGLVRQRRLILDGLTAATARDASASVDDLIEETTAAAARAGVFARRDSRQQRRRETARWVLRELVAIDERHSLEGLGLVRVELDREPHWLPPRPLLDLGLSPDEAWALLSELLRTLRLQGALTMPEEVDPRDEVFDPRRGPVYVRGDGAEAKLKVLSWLPTRGVNRRLDYLRRLLAALPDAGAGPGTEPRGILDGCWRWLAAQPEGWLKASSLPNLGRVQQLDHTWLTLSRAAQIHRCTRCRRVASASVRGVCPTLGCAGVLQAAEPDPDEHYSTLYRTTSPVPLVAREHTAQWTSLEAADIQQRFLAGEINVLSCSTTFELGVDVGELQGVVLRNMPPSTANYIQRAGRAGRRSAAAALVLTYAQRRSHDLSRFQAPEVMIAGQLRAPYVPLGNARIDRRHAHSVALAAFFRHAKENWGQEYKSAGAFFLGGGPSAKAGQPPCSRVQAFLTPVPDAVRETLEAVLPPGVHKEIGIDDGSWVRHLADHLEQVRAELAQDVAVFEERRTEAFAARRSEQAARFERSVNTVTRRSLIGFLANRNILPKYGFPVDTVDLRTAHCDSQVGARLELSRDLAVAIHEYAPGAELVAGGVLWKSGGVYRLPGRELISRCYVVCRECRHYREGGTDLEPACPACGRPADGPVREYLVPEFGFVAEHRTAKPAATPPSRSWSGDTHVVSLGDELAETRWHSASGAVVWCRAGARGRLVSLSEGPNGGGYLICQWCGWGAANQRKTPKSHTDPLRGKACTGPLRWRSLAHGYETDILQLRIDAPGQHSAYGDSSDRRLSLLYALLEGATTGLEIARDDIGGAPHAAIGGHGGRDGLVLFDTVPGGAGSALRIGLNLDIVVRASHARLSACDCGPETSCYGCLRNRRNEHHHERLARGHALEALESLAGLAVEADVGLEVDPHS